MASRAGRRGGSCGPPGTVRDSANEYMTERSDRITDSCSWVYTMCGSDERENM